MTGSVSAMLLEIMPGALLHKLVFVQLLTMKTMILLMGQKFAYIAT